MFSKVVRRPSPAMLVATLALFVSMGGVTYAANGDSWKLGFPNSASSSTQLTGTVNGKLVKLTNNSGGGSASALSLNVASGKPPMTVNSSTKVNNLNADQLDGQDSSAFLPAGGEAVNSDNLDGLDSAAFGRLIALRTSNTSATIAAGDNYILVPAWTPDVSGRCLVSAETQIIGSANTDIGPYYRLAIKQGAATPVADGFYGHYFVPDPTGYTDDYNRITAVNVTAGVPVQFGAFLGSAAPDWAGDVAYVHVTADCTTIGTLPGAATAARAHDGARQSQR